LRKERLITDAEVGPTKMDLTMIRRMEEREKDLIVVPNKIDKVKKSSLKSQLAKIQKQVGKHEIIPYSATEKQGVDELFGAITGQ